MTVGRAHLVRIGFVLLLVSCGSDDGSVATTPVSISDTSTTSPTVASAPTTTTSAPGTTTTVTSSTTTAPTTSTVAPTTGPIATTPVEVEYPAVWPASDVVITTPEAAAADFVSSVLGVPPLLGEFQQGDMRSGEIVVFSPTDDDDPATVFPRGLLALRQLGPNDGWFVIAATSEGVSITSPAPAAMVGAGPIVVEGLGRGFESNLVVRAIVAGDAEAVLDLEFTMTDWTTPVPYAVTLDVSAAAEGDVITLVAVGDTGLGTDPSEFAAIAVVVAG